MLRIRFTIITLAAVGFLFGHGCSSLPEPVTIAKTDATLAGDVYYRLSNDSFVRGGNIGVEAKDGMITLSGLPHESARRARAISIAAGTPGVDKVTNELY